MSIAYQEPSYPVVRLLLRFERFVGPVAGLIAILGIVFWMWPSLNLPLLMVALVVGAIVGLLMQSYVEILRIISDTLLPR